MLLRRLSFALIMLATLQCRDAAAQGTPAFTFRFTEKPGPYEVGLKVLQEHDGSRSFAAATDEAGESSLRKASRPIQMLVWYPAQESSNKPMTLGDYASLVYTETSFNQPVHAGKAQAFVEQYMHGLTSVPTRAVRSAKLLLKRFPLVIYAPSVGAAATENIELCEYLASQGFVVMASPSMGATSRDMTLDVVGANAEAQDISFLIDCARTFPNTDMSEIAVMGYSWGGMSALFSAARDKRIVALISLDGSFRYSPETVREAADVHPDQMKIPLLVLSRAEETLESWDATRQVGSGSSPNVLNEWTHGDLVHIRLLAVSHIQFSSMYQRSERFRREGGQFLPADYSLEEGAESYEWMAKYASEFLSAYLKHDGNALLFLKSSPTENNVARHLMAASFRAAGAGAGR